MHPYLEIAGFVLYGVAATFWIISAHVRLTPIGPGIDELDKVHQLVGDLQRAASWSAGAFCTALGLLLQAAARYWPSA